MTADGRPYADVLADAQVAGYAEADPAGDVEGHDAANKLVILARLAFGVWLDPESISPGSAASGGSPGLPGITGVTLSDIEAAAEQGLAIKLIASATRAPGRRRRGGASRRPWSRRFGVRPDRRRAQPHRGRRAPIGTVAFSGPGAGGAATSSAVLADLIAIGRQARQHVGRACAGLRSGRRRSLRPDVEVFIGPSGTAYPVIR